MTLFKKKEKKEYIKRTRLGEFWHQFKKNKGACVGLVILILLFLVVVFGDYLWDYKEEVTWVDLNLKKLGVSWEHPFGTDNLGRDMLARIGYGARYSLAIGFGTTFIAVIIGTTLGAIAGYYGDPIETIIMRIIEVYLMIPGVLLVICVVTALGYSVGSLIVAIGLTTTPKFARLARTAVLSTRACEYVEAAKAAGASDLHIIFRHVLPNGISPILVQITMTVAGNIIAASSYSYLGLGVPAPKPEWGLLLSEGRSSMRLNPELTLFPGLAIMITVLALNLVGDGVRDALDPRLKR